MAKKKQTPKGQSGNPAKQAKRGKRHVRLIVISEEEAKGRSVLRYTGEGTVGMKGSGNLVMECGSCGVPLVEGMPMSSFRSMVFKCPNCGAYNESMA